MSKLTDAQLVILSQAATRPDHAVLPPPPSLTLNKAALTRVIGSLLSRGLLAERAAVPGEAIWREEDDYRLALAVTLAGFEAIGIIADDQATTVGKHPRPPVAPSKPRPGTGKAADVLALLSRPEGAGIADLNAATDWQAHSIRAFLSGLRKKGIEIERTKDGAGKAVYHVVAQGAGDDA